MISGMISRAQKYIFFAMLMACVVMAAFLIRLRNRAQDRLQAAGDERAGGHCGDDGHRAEDGDAVCPQRSG